MSGRLQQRWKDGSAGKRRSDGGGGPWHLLLCLGAVLVLTPWHIIASSAVFLRSAPSRDPREARVPAPEGPNQKKPSATIKVPLRPIPSLDEQLDDAMEEAKKILRRSPKMLDKLSTVLNTRMDLETRIAQRIMSSKDHDPDVDEEKVNATAKLLREKLLHRPAVASKFVRFLYGRQPTTLEDLEDYIRNIDISQAAPATSKGQEAAPATSKGQEAAPIKEEA